MVIIINRLLCCGERLKRATGADFDATGMKVIVLQDNRPKRVMSSLPLRVINEINRFGE